MLSRLIVLCVALVFVARPVSAQQTEFQGFRRNLASVIFCGLGGAVLGLSTLSFYGQPQEHTGNIYAGLGLGLLVGTAYVFMNPKPTDWGSLPPEKPFMRLADFERDSLLSAPPEKSFPLAGYRWDF